MNADFLELIEGKFAEVGNVFQVGNVRQLFKQGPPNTGSSRSTRRGFRTCTCTASRARRGNGDENIGKCVANPASGIIDERVVIEKALGQSLEECSGFLRHYFEQSRNCLGRQFNPLCHQLFGSHIAAYNTTNIVQDGLPPDEPDQFDQVNGGFNEAVIHRLECSCDGIHPRALGELRNARVESINEESSGFVDLVDQALEVSFGSGHRRTARPLITGGVKHGRAALGSRLAARISLVVLCLLDRPPALFPSRANLVALALCRQQRRRIRLICRGGIRKGNLCVQPALDLQVEFITEVIRSAALPAVRS